MSLGARSVVAASVVRQMAGGSNDDSADAGDATASNMVTASKWGREGISNPRHRRYARLARSGDCGYHSMQVQPRLTLTRFIFDDHPKSGLAGRRGPPAHYPPQTPRFCF